MALAACYEAIPRIVRILPTPILARQHEHCDAYCDGSGREECGRIASEAIEGTAEMMMDWDRYHMDLMSRAIKPQKEIASMHYGLVMRTAADCQSASAAPHLFIQTRMSR